MYRKRQGIICKKRRAKRRVKGRKRDTKEVDNPKTQMINVKLLRAVYLFLSIAHKTSDERVEFSGGKVFEYMYGVPVFKISTVLGYRNEIITAVISMTCEGETNQRECKKHACVSFRPAKTKHEPNSK